MLVWHIELSNQRPQGGRWRMLQRQERAKGGPWGAGGARGASEWPSGRRYDDERGGWPSARVGPLPACGVHEKGFGVVTQVHRYFQSIFFLLLLHVYVRVVGRPPPRFPRLALGFGLLLAASPIVASPTWRSVHRLPTLCTQSKSHITLHNSQHPVICSMNTAVITTSSSHRGSHATIYIIHIIIG